MYAFKKLVSLVLCLCVFLIVGHVSVCKAQENPVSLLRHASASNICRYVVPGLKITTTAPKPALFRNVKNIYIYSSSDGFRKNDLSLFKSDALSELGDCILQAHLSYKGTKGSPIPIYIADVSTVKDIPEANENGNLVVNINASRREGSFYKDSIQQSLVVLQAKFYRKDTHDIESVLYQCAESFPLVSDADEMQKILTDVLGGCLKSPYHSMISSDN